MEQNSYHILIYGTFIDKDIKCISPFKEYYTPMRDEKGLNFIGFQFDRINRLYQDYIHDPNILIISNVSPSQAIKNLWNETYPEIEGKCYCLIQNVSHYTNGSVAYGYWINTENYETDDLLNDFHMRGKNINGMTMFSPDHVQSDSTPAPFFYGKLLARLPENEDENDCELSATNFMKIYKPQNIPSRLECLNDIINKIKIDPKSIIFFDQPEITVICNMCYCCT